MKSVTLASYKALMAAVPQIDNMMLTHDKIMELMSADDPIAAVMTLRTNMNKALDDVQARLVTAAAEDHAYQTQMAAVASLDKDRKALADERMAFEKEKTMLKNVVVPAPAKPAEPTIINKPLS